MVGSMLFILSLSLTMRQNALLNRLTLDVNKHTAGEQDRTVRVETTGIP